MFLLSTVLLDPITTSVRSVPRQERGGVRERWGAQPTTEAVSSAWLTTVGYRRTLWQSKRGCIVFLKEELNVDKQSAQYIALSVLKKILAGQWWCMPLIPALERQRQENF